MRNDEPYCRRVLSDIDRRLQKPVDLSEGALLFDRRKDAMGDFISETDESSVSHSSDPEYHASARQCDRPSPYQGPLRHSRRAREQPRQGLTPLTKMATSNGRGKTAVHCKEFKSSSKI